MLPDVINSIMTQPYIHQYRYSNDYGISIYLEIDKFEVITVCRELSVVSWGHISPLSTNELADVPIMFVYWSHVPNQLVLCATALHKEAYLMMYTDSFYIKQRAILIKDKDADGKLDRIV